MQAAVGLAQLDKLDGFVAGSGNNWQYLRDALRPLQEVLIVPEPTRGTEPSWFGFVLTDRDGGPL
jgi:CDP-6-deoxy-D-xylo-4-hexulose-3-dehydrase